ncbi:unnamed protein product [Phytophthora fragariaefolia]|uniref:Unnamed protein product n=1 Tax=Phytophthora fragariaefolia TaxID=1490495 RepID=A0A9W7D8L6_9STRA|nr:unnamed protein product [Phytophthora fragariaefolia]
MAKVHRFRLGTFYLASWFIWPVEAGVEAEPDPGACVNAIREPPQHQALKQSSSIVPLGHATVELCFSARCWDSQVEAVKIVDEERYDSHEGRYRQSIWARDDSNRYLLMWASLVVVIPTTLETSPR